MESIMRILSLIQVSILYKITVTYLSQGRIFTLYLITFFLPSPRVCCILDVVSAKLFLAHFCMEMCASERDLTNFSCQEKHFKKKKNCRFPGMELREIGLLDFKTWEERMIFPQRHWRLFC